LPITRRHWRRIEAPSGEGIVYDGNQHIATVTYGLRVLQEVVGRRHWSGSTAIQGERRVHGRLEVIGDTLPLGGDPLTLRLSDGRSLPFIAVENGSFYTITPVGTLS